jgi:predicted DNA-binding transcriptional regulator AlpA
MDSAKDFYSIEEASQITGKNRATIYNRMKILGIKPRKFKMDRKAYVNAAELEQIKTIFAKPWMAGEKEPKSQESSSPKNDIAA